LNDYLNTFVLFLQCTFRPKIVNGAPSREAEEPSKQTTRTAWHSQENKMGYTSLVNYSFKYKEEVGSIPATAARWTPSRNQASAHDPANIHIKKSYDAARPDGLQEDAVVPGTVKKALVLSVGYRETDLDEYPTNFTLQFQENDEDNTTDSDTMQTYCMKRTPYEAPFMRSSVKSLTDLLELDCRTRKKSFQLPAKRYCTISSYCLTKPLI